MNNSIKVTNMQEVHELLINHRAIYTVVGDEVVYIQRRKITGAIIIEVINMNDNTHYSDDIATGTLDYIFKKCNKVFKTIQ